MTGVVLSVVVAGWLVWLFGFEDEGEGGDRSRVRSAAAVVAARSGTIAFFSLDVAHVQDDIDRVLALGTGRFRSEYLASREQVVSRVRQRQLVVTADVPADGVALESYDDDRAKVLVGVDVVTREPGESVRTDHYRMRAQVVRSGETWKVSALDRIDGDPDPSGYVVAGLTEADADAVTAAADAAAKALGYDHRRLDAGLEAALAVMTPAFGREFRTTFESAVRPLATEKKVVAPAYVRGAGLVRRQASRARVLIFADQVVSPGPDGEPTEVRVLLDLERSGESWLVAGITPY